MSIVIEEPDVSALLMVTAPVRAEDVPVPPVTERRPVLLIVTVPPRDTGEPETPIPEPFVTVIDEFWSSEFVTTPVERTPDALVCTTPAVNPPSAMFPVAPPPRVNVCLLVVVREPALSRTREPDRVAVCCPLALFTPVIANLAAVVDCPPTRRSTVELFGYSVPLAWLQ